MSSNIGVSPENVIYHLIFIETQVIEWLLENKYMANLHNHEKVVVDAYIIRLHPKCTSVMRAREMIFYVLRSLGFSSVEIAKLYSTSPSRVHKISQRIVGYFKSGIYPEMTQKAEQIIYYVKRNQ